MSKLRQIKMDLFLVGSMLIVLAIFLHIVDEITPLILACGSIIGGTLAGVFATMVQDYVTETKRLKRRESIKRTSELSDEEIDDIESDLTGTFGDELGGILAKGVKSGSVKIGI